MSNYQHKRSAVAGKIPLASDLLDGEIAVNIKDRKLFAKDDQGVVFEFSGGNGGAVDTVNNIVPVNGNVTLNALNIPPTSDRLWLTQAERQLIASFDAYDKVESDDRYLLETNNLSDLTDASTARANLGLGNLATISLSGNPYHTDNILGTVSQSGGVPTGAIIESGSNPNGSYVKYADGTMVCNGEVDFIGVITGQTLTLIYTHPSTFSSIPKKQLTAGTSFSASLNKASLIYDSGLGSDTSQTRLAIQNTSDVTTDYKVTITLHGRWY